jgi:hypothetical protein
VVVEPRADLDLGSVGQAPVGDVGLPDLVGRGSLEPDPRAARALARLGRHEPRRVEDAPDGRGRRDPETLALEVPGDRDRARIEAAAGELRAQLDDPRTHGLGRPAGVAAWPARARLQGLEAAVPVPAEQAVQVLPAHPVRGRGGGDGQLLRDDLEDGHTVLRHAPDCRACPDSSDAYQLSPMSWTQTPSPAPNPRFPRGEPFSPRRSTIRPPLLVRISWLVHATMLGDTLGG